MKTRKMIAGGLGVLAAVGLVVFAATCFQGARRGVGDEKIIRLWVSPPSPVCMGKVLTLTATLSDRAPEPMISFLVDGKKFDEGKGSGAMVTFDTGDPPAQAVGKIPGTVTFKATAYRYDGSNEVQVTVCEVVITEPGEGDVFLHGDKVTFKAEVKPSSLYVNRWRWRVIEGSGRPRSGRTDTFAPIVFNASRDFAKPAPFKARVTAEIEDGPTCEAERNIEIVWPRICKIDFLNWRGTAKKITHEHDWAEHSPEWVAAKGTTPAMTDSVSGFESGTRIKLKATFQTVEPLTRATQIDRLYANAAWSARADPDCESMTSTVTVSGQETEIEMEGVADLYNDVFAYDGSSRWRRIAYDWFYEIQGTGKRYHIDPRPPQNIHDLYVTLFAPTPAQVYETLLYITCIAADRRGNDVDTVAGIWSEFQDLVVTRKDRQQMTYWKTASPPADTEGLLRTLDGRCGAWARGLNDCILTHGIAGSAAKGIYPLDQPPDLEARGFSVDPNLDAQGNPNPRTDFADHAVVVYGGEIYDPSYGKKSPSLIAWEDASLVEFGYWNTTTHDWVYLPIDMVTPPRTEIK